MYLARGKFGLGWKRQLPDFRDPKYSDCKSLKDVTLPPVIDLSHWGPAIYDQGSLGSCTANAGAALAQYLMMKTGKKHIYRPSRLAIYYWERALENTVSTDSGASLRDCINVLTTNGVPGEWLMPYDVSKFKQKPSSAVVDYGVQHKVSGALSVDQNLQEIQHCLSEGHPIIFGFTVYDSFESNAVAKSGIVPMPQPNEQVLGGHATMIVGLDVNKQYFKVRNSWGADWGDKGYFYMPFSYMFNQDLVSDLWTAGDVA